MERYYITITETLERTIEIVAESEEEALYTAEKEYQNGEHVLDYEDHVNTDFSTYMVESLESEAE